MLSNLEIGEMSRGYCHGNWKFVDMVKMIGVLGDQSKMFIPVQQPSRVHLSYCDIFDIVHETVE